MIKRLGVTEGQVYTMAIGFVLALVLIVTGIPPVLRNRAAPAGATTGLVRRASGTATNGASASSPAAAGVAAPPNRQDAASAPVALSGLPSALPPGLTVVPTPSVPPLTITTFAVVDHPGAPGGVTIGRDGQIYVTTDNGAARGDQGPSHVFVYDSGGHRTADMAVTGQPNGHVHGLTGAAVDVDGRSVVALEPDAARVIAVDLSAGTQRAVATVPDLPACLVALGSPTCQPGVDDRNPLPIAAAFDRVGNLFITDPLQDTVWRLRPGANVAEVWYQSNFFTLGDGPYGLAVHDNVVDFTVGTTLDPAARGGGGLYRVAVNADGTAGTPTLVSLFGRGDEPGPLAVGGTGTAYVVLRGSGTLVAIAPTGSEAWRIAPPGSGAIPLDAPSALALIGGRLLVTNAGTGTDPSHWAVLSVAVMDGPAQ